MRNANLKLARRWPQPDKRRWLTLALIAGIFALAGCSASERNDSATSEWDGSAVGTVSSSTEGGTSMGFPAVAPAPPSEGASPSGMAMDGDRGGTGEVFPQEESLPSMQSTMGRAVIRNGQMELVVESVEDSFQQVRQITESAGGYVSASTFTGRDTSQRAYLTLRIPSDQFDSIMERLRDIAVEVPTASTNSQDVTEEYADLQARLRNQRAVEEQYLTLLAEASEIGEILQVQDRLMYTRFEIERIEGRINLLDSLTSLSTLEVTLSPERNGSTEQTEPGFTERVREAWEDSITTLGSIGTGIVLAVVWGWWIIPAVLVTLLLARRILGRAMSGMRARDARPAEHPVDASDHVDTPDGSA